VLKRRPVAERIVVLDPGSGLTEKPVSGCEPVALAIGVALLTLPDLLCHFRDSWCENSMEASDAAFAYRIVSLPRDIVAARLNRVTLPEAPIDIG